MLISFILTDLSIKKWKSSGNIRRTSMEQSKDGYYIFRTWITSKDGERIYAKDHGKKAFRIWITREKKKKK